MGLEHGRGEERVPVGGTLRLMVKSGAGFLIASGEIMDLSPGGCAIRVEHRSMEAGLHGRVDMAIAGESLSLPIVTRWVRADSDAWIVGCRFDELTFDDRRAIHALIAETQVIAI